MKEIEKLLKILNGGISYNQIGHSHCFESDNPRCGLKWKHKCCFCGKNSE